MAVLAAAAHNVRLQLHGAGRADGGVRGLP